MSVQENPGFQLDGILNSEMSYPVGNVDLELVEDRITPSIVLKAMKFRL